MSFPAYDDYPEPPLRLLGKVPEHWNVIQLKWFSTLHRGYDLTNDEFEDGPYPVVTSGGITGLHSAAMARGPGVVTGRYGSTGQLFFVEEDYWPHNTTLFVSDFHGNDERFVWYSLQIVDFASHSAKSAVPGIDRNDLHVLPVAVPSLNEQKAISAFLDVETAKIDALVSEQRRLIELLKEKRQAVISHAVTKGLNPNAPMKPSGIQWLGDVPEHWRLQRLKHAITSIEQGWSPQCENEPVANDDQWGVLKVGCVNYGRFTATENKALPTALEPQPELGILEGDLLISRANTVELVGSAAIADRDYKNLMLCDKLYRLRMDHALLLPEFLCFYLTSDVAREPIEFGASGASPSMKNIAQSVILELWFASPDVAEQKEIVWAIRERSDAITQLMAEAERGIELLQERRTALISAAVTGKIDVREFAKRATI